MKCAFCKYSVPVKNTPYFNCTYNADNSKRAEKCDVALQFMWEYCKMRANEMQNRAYNVKRVVKRLETDKFVPQGVTLSDTHKGYIEGLDRAINVVKAEAKNENN